MAYRQYCALCLKSQLAHKLSFLLISAGQFLVAFSTYMGIQFLFARFHAVEGFTKQEVLLCYGIVLMAFSLGKVLSGGLDHMSALLSNGMFDRILVRPRSPLLQVIFGHLDLGRVGLLAQGVVVLWLSLRQGVVVWTAGRIVTLCLMILCGCALFVGFFLVGATLTIFTVEGEFLNIFTYGGKEFGRYPFAIYGREVLSLLTWLIPLAWFQYYPLLYLLGRTEDPRLIFSPLVSLLFLIPCRIFWQFGLRKYRSTGS